MRHSTLKESVLACKSNEEVGLVRNLHWTIIILSLFIVMKGSSLMQRRKVNLGQLKNTIQELSILQKEQPTLGSSFTLKNHSNCQSVITGDQEQELTINKAVEAIPLPGRQIAIRKKLSEEPEENLKSFDQSFQTFEVLGEGAHGIVKRCIHRITGHVYAVKILKMQDQHCHFLKTNFINIKQLKHDSVIEYKALFLNPKQQKCHLVMEYLPYPHLRSLRRLLKEDELKSVFYRLVEALQYIHKNNICHRDIKPENVLYDREKGVFKIIDFGVSKNMKLRGRYEEMLTKTGTLYYKAPQMFYGGGYTEKVDSWAVGITLYEMVVGVTPFASDYHGQTIENILRKEPDTDRQQFRSCEPILKDLIARLLKRNPKERMTCQQAKKHLWFNSNLSEIDTLRSANFQLLNFRHTQDKENFHQNSLIKNTSVAGPNKIELQEVTKTDKKVMKKYLEIMSKQPNIIREELAIDFVQSEDEAAENAALTKSQPISTIIQNEVKAKATGVLLNKICSQIPKGKVEA